MFMLFSSRTWFLFQQLYEMAIQGKLEFKGQVTFVGKYLFT